MVNVTDILQDFGYLGMFAIIFVESGLFLGLILPLPGDSLLLTLGVLAANHTFSLTYLLPVLIIAAIAGDTVGYITGYKSGSRIFSKNNARFLKPTNITKSQHYFQKHGAKTVVIARFLPHARTIVPILAGVGKMSYKRFLFYNVVGAALWVTSITLLGYYIGDRVPNIDKFLVPLFVGGIIVTGITTYAFKYYRQRKECKQKEPVE